jgi:hypothetical protein
MYGDPSCIDSIKARLFINNRWRYLSVAPEDNPGPPQQAFSGVIAGIRVDVRGYAGQTVKLKFPYRVHGKVVKVLKRIADLYGR